MNPADCPFCTVDPARVAAETALTLTLRDGFPVAPGHTLIVPKRHFADLFDATEAEAAALWQALRRAADALRRAPPGSGRPPDGFNVGVNVGAAAGQTVMHLHWHLIPRWIGDQPDPRGGIRRIFPDLADYWSAPEP